MNRSTANQSPVRNTTSLLAATILLLAATALPASAQISLVEVGAERGIGAFVMEYGKAGSVLAVDYDDDGDIDIFAPNAGGVADQLYRNNGYGTFTEVAAEVGLDSVARGRAALFFDYDGDRRLDLFVAGDCWNAVEIDCPDTSTLRLMRQTESGVFVDVTAAAGIPDDQIENDNPHRGAAAAGDYDGDGDLDLIFGIWQGTARLLRNDDGVFTEISDESGVGEFGFQWQPVWHDFNGDGRMDIYHATDFGPNLLWIREDEGFKESAVDAGLDNAWNDMGLAFGDYDNDGDFDIYVTNITTNDRNNVLYRNDSTEGGLAYTRVSFEAGVAQSGWDWGTTFFDADNDGDLDLVSTNGWFGGDSATDQSSFFRNDGGNPVTFSKISEAAGFDDNLWGSSVNAADFDRDGDLDLVQSCNGSGTQPHQIRVLDNRSAGLGHYLVIRPRMPGANYRAIGAVVRIEAGGRSMMRLITAGTSSFGQEPAEAFFGLGSAETVERLIVEWPDGIVNEWTDIDADQVITVEPFLFRDGFESGDLSGWD